MPMLDCVKNIYDLSFNCVIIDKDQKAWSMQLIELRHWSAWSHHWLNCDINAKNCITWLTPLIELWNWHKNCVINTKEWMLDQDVKVWNAWSTPKIEICDQRQRLKCMGLCCMITDYNWIVWSSPIIEFRDQCQW